jgi:hypothetical protein
MAAGLIDSESEVGSWLTECSTIRHGQSTIAGDGLASKL